MCRSSFGIQKMSETRICIKGLPPDVDEPGLRERFSERGEVTDAKVIRTGCTLHLLMSPSPLALLTPGQSLTLPGSTAWRVLTPCAARRPPASDGFADAVGMAGPASSALSVTHLLRRHRTRSSTSTKASLAPSAWSWRCAFSHAEPVLLALMGNTGCAGSRNTSVSTSIWLRSQV